MLRKTTIVSALVIGLLFLQHTSIFSQNILSVPAKPCWSLDLELNSGTPVVANAEGAIFLSFEDGVLISLNSLAGKTTWRAELGGEIVGKIIASGNSVYVVTRLKTVDNSGEVFRIHALSSATGLTAWRSEFSRLPILVTETSGRVIFYFEDGSLLALDAQTGEHLAETSFRKKISAVTFSRGSIGIAFVDDGRIAFVDSRLGAAEFVSVLGTPKDFEVIKNNAVIVGDRIGNLASYSLRRKSQLWKSKVGAEISSLAETSRGILVISFDNFVYLFSDSGKRIWKRRLSGRSIGEPLIYAETVFLATRDGDTAYAIDLKQGRIISQIILDDENSFSLNPVLAGSVFVFTTRRGIVAYGEICSQK